MIDFDAFDALTFDCYGTLIDWETGILAAPAHRARRRTAPTPATRRCWRRSRAHEARARGGSVPALREVLAGCLRALGEELGFDADAPRRDAFGRSVEDWPAFAGQRRGARPAQASASGSA